MDIKIHSRDGLKIKKYVGNNITVLLGRPGSGKTYTMNKALELDSSKKLLIACSSDCEADFLTVRNMTKVPYYETRWNTSVSENFRSLLNELQNNVSNGYEIIILDNILFDSYNQISTLFNTCLQYPETKFFILLDKVLDQKTENFDIKFFIG